MLMCEVSEWEMSGCQLRCISIPNHQDFIVNDTIKKIFVENCFKKATTLTDCSHKNVKKYTFGNVLVWCGCSLYFQVFDKPIFS